VNGLKNAVNQANGIGDVTIMLKDGIYQLDEALFVTGDGITIRSESGDRDKVIIRGEGVTGYLIRCIAVSGKNFTVADVSMGLVFGEALRILHDADDCLVHNVRFFDCGSYMVSVRGQAGGQSWTDRGIIEWCLFEYAEEADPNPIAGGISAAQADSWSIRYNIFKDISGPGAATVGFAIAFSYLSNNTIVEHNTISGCDHGVAIGGGSTDDCQGGIIRNNMIQTMNVGIRLESAASVSIYNNSIFVESDQEAAIEYRYAGTQYASIINNLANAEIWARDGATGVVETNVTDAQLSWFEDAEEGDLHLVRAVEAVVDQGQTLSAVELDFDCEERPKGDGYDIGADEY
jgi:hypothetical protein